MLYAHFSGNSVWLTHATSYCCFPSPPAFRAACVEIASQVDYHTLQVLSRGTAWPETHLWGLFTAGALGVCAFVFAVCGSLLMRLLVLPAFKETA